MFDSGIFLVAVQPTAGPALEDSFSLSVLSRSAFGVKEHDHSLGKSENMQGVLVCISTQSGPMYVVKNPFLLAKVDFNPMNTNSI